MQNLICLVVEKKHNIASSSLFIIFGDRRHGHLTLSHMSRKVMCVHCSHDFEAQGSYSGLRCITCRKIDPRCSTCTMGVSDKYKTDRFCRETDCNAPVFCCKRCRPTQTCAEHTTREKSDAAANVDVKKVGRKQKRPTTTALPASVFQKKIQRVR